MKRDLVELDRDHPGFRDPEYRARRNAIARAALEHRAGDPAPRVEYTDEEDRVWTAVLAHLSPLHARVAAPLYQEAWPRLGLVSDRVAQLREVSERLTAATGFHLEPVAGLVSPRAFMSALADGIFLATQYMRHGSRPLYTPEPDVIHELVGHGPLLLHPGYAELNRRFGEATRRASDAEVEALIRVYWYGLEFGLVREGGEERVIGAGLLSSFGELGRLPEVPRRPMAIGAMAETPFDPSDYQRVYFVAESTTALLETIGAWLDRVGR